MNSTPNNVALRASLGVACLFFFGYTSWTILLIFFLSFNFRSCCASFAAKSIFIAVWFKVAESEKISDGECSVLPTRLSLRRTFLPIPLKPKTGKYIIQHRFSSLRNRILTLFQNNVMIRYIRAGTLSVITEGCIK